MQIYTIYKDSGFFIPCFDNQDQALDIALSCPVGDMFLDWRGVETVAPCWIRFRKGGIEHYVAAFHIEVEGELQVIALALFRDGEVATTHCASLGPPENGKHYAFAQFVRATVGSTCLGPE